jgi:O-antigen/teichoic acid export membrane protein
MQRLFDLLLMLSVGVALPVSIFAQEITLFIYGEAYTDSARVLALHIWTGVFVIIKSAATLWLLTQGLEKYSYYQNFVAVIINIL